MAPQEGRLECREDRAAVHLLGHWESEQSEDRRSDVENRSLFKVVILEERLAGEDQDPVFAMPVRGLAVTDTRVGQRTVVTCAEAVVGTDDDGRVPTGRLDQTTHQIIRVPVVLVDGVP